MTGRLCPVMEHLPRVEAKIDPALRDLFLDLASGKSDWPLFLYGATGRGKTCAALWLLDQVPFSLYVSIDRCVQWVLSRENEIWERCGEYTLTVVDELRLRSRESDLEYAALKKIADAREHRPTIWISNHRPEKIASLYDDRIYSRICCGTWFCLEGYDKRMR